MIETIIFYFFINSYLLFYLNIIFLKNNTYRRKLTDERAD